MGHVICVAQQKGGSGKTTIAANLAVAFSRAGESVALLDTDPQGSLGRWFMARRDLGGEDLGFSTASAWGVSYECDKLRRAFDWVIVDTPPKVDADLRPALREADLVIVPVSVSQVDVWATDSVLDLARREGRATMMVLNRTKRGTRLLEEIVKSLDSLDAPRAATMLGNRMVYAETLGQGLGVVERGRGAWTDEIQSLAAEVKAALQG
jgi:chromosome partitioning protein